MNEIIYPIILTYEEDIIYGGVPDLNIDNYVTSGKTIEEVLSNLKEIITLTLLDLEDNKNEFPKASEIKELKKTLECVLQVIFSINCNFKFPTFIHCKF